jgi:hypothetical protein
MKTELLWENTVVVLPCVTNPTWTDLQLCAWTMAWLSQCKQWQIKTKGHVVGYSQVKQQGIRCKWEWWLLILTALCFLIKARIIILMKLYIYQWLMVIPDIGSDNWNKQDSNTWVFNPLKSALQYESTSPSIAPQYLKEHCCVWRFPGFTCLSFW